MADIFDLARNINARRKQASQGYASGFEDLPMQVMEMMDTRAKEKRVSLKNDSKFLSEMIANAKTPDQLNNVTNLANTHIKETFSDPEMKLYGEALNMQLSNKNSAHKNYTAAMEWADSMSNKEVGYDDRTESGIKRKNALELSETELTTLTGDDFKNLFETYQGYEDAIAQGQAYGFNYTRGKSSNKTLISQLGKYRDTLDSAIQAHLSGNVITDNEAVAISMGRYNEAKKEAIRDIGKDISFYRSSISRTQKAIDSLRKSGLKQEPMAMYPNLISTNQSIFDEIGVDVGENDSVEKIIKDLETRRNRYQTEFLDPLFERKYFWTGMKEGVQVEADIFVDGNDDGGDNSNVVEEPPVSKGEPSQAPEGEPSKPKKQKFDQDEFEAMMPASEMPSYEEKAYGTSFDDLVKMISPKEEPSNPERQRQSQKFDTSNLKPQEVLKTIRELPKELKKEYQDNKKSIDKKQVAKELRENKVMMNPSSLINILSLVHIPEYRKILENDLSKMLSPNGYTFKWLRNKGRVDA